MSPLISYLITVYNKQEDLKDLLETLRAQTGLGSAEVEFVFADDASSDASVDYLKAEADNDPRIKVIQNTENCGPSIRINQAAQHACGSYFIPLDADDYLPENATVTFLNTVRDTGSPLVFGESKRGSFPPPDIAADAMTTVANDPLAYCARKKIVHMGFMVEQDLWHRSGGADERIFIQDQSLPLRLSAHAPRLAYIHDVVYWLRPALETNLSRNTAQQHHDRFFAALYQMRESQPSPEAQKELSKQMVSARWKLERESSQFAYLSLPFFSYMANRVFSISPSENQLNSYASQMAQLKDIRRVS